MTSCAHQHLQAHFAWASCLKKAALRPKQAKVSSRFAVGKVKKQAVAKKSEQRAQETLAQRFAWTQGKLGGSAVRRPLVSRTAKRPALLTPLVLQTRLLCRLTAGRGSPRAAAHPRATPLLCTPKFWKKTKRRRKVISAQFRTAYTCCQARQPRQPQAHKRKL